MSKNPTEPARFRVVALPGVEGDPELCPGSLGPPVCSQSTQYACGRGGAWPGLARSVAQGPSSLHMQEQKSPLDHIHLVTSTQRQWPLSEQSRRDVKCRGQASHTRLLCLLLCCRVAHPSHARLGWTRTAASRAADEKAAGRWGAGAAQQPAAAVVQQRQQARQRAHAVLSKPRLAKAAHRGAATVGGLR